LPRRRGSAPPNLRAVTPPTISTVSRVRFSNSILFVDGGGGGGGGGGGKNISCPRVQGTLATPLPRLAFQINYQTFFFIVYSYEVKYGDHTFDPEKFPSAKGMIDRLHDLGFRVTTWVTPFINYLSNNYKTGDTNRYFVINERTNKSGLVPWWNGAGFSIDFTNFDACNWYVIISVISKITNSKLCYLYCADHDYLIF